MRDGVRLVNAARGELVDEDALLEALRSGKVAAAALDVFNTEPYSGPLLELDNVIVTPHLAASTEEAQDRAGVIVAEQVAAALEGSLVTNAVNIPSIGAEDLEILGPFIPLAATLGRLAMELAGGAARADRACLLRLAFRLRHATADGGGAERRLPGALGPAGELRQRSDDRRGERGRGRRGAPPCVARLHEPRPGLVEGERRRAARGRARRSAESTAAGSSARSASSWRWSWRR